MCDDKKKDRESWYHRAGPSLAIAVIITVSLLAMLMLIWPVSTEAKKQKVEYQVTTEFLYSHGLAAASYEEYLDEHINFPRSPVLSKEQLATIKGYLLFAQALVKEGESVLEPIEKSLKNIEDKNPEDSIESARKILASLKLASRLIIDYDPREKVDDNARAHLKDISLYGLNWDPEYEMRVSMSDEVGDPPSEITILLVVAIVGGLGGSLYILSSLSAFMGSGTFKKSWLAFYLVRPFIGAGLGVLMYFLIRGGFMVAGTGAEDFDVFGIAAIAGLSGLFSVAAMDKLRDVAHSLFTKKKRNDSIDGDSPEIVKVSNPQKGTDDIWRFTVTGSYFWEESVVLIEGKERQTERLSKYTLEVSLLNEDLNTNDAVFFCVANSKKLTECSDLIRLKSDG